MYFDTGIEKLVAEVLENKKLCSFLEVDDESTLIYGKKKSKERKVIVSLPNKKLAQTDEDFKAIYKREITERLKGNQPKEEFAFKKELSEYVSLLIKEHKEKYPYDRNRDHEAIQVAESFMGWLNSSQDDKSNENLSFESKMNDTEIGGLTNTINGIRLFTADIAHIKNILQVPNLEKVTISNNQLLSFLFDALANKGKITREWKAVAGKSGCFISKNGKQLSNNDLSVARTNVGNKQNNDVRFKAVTAFVNTL